MSTAFKKKTYGKVRPVPKVKEKAPRKPSISQYRQILTRLKKSPAREHLDLISEALLWWQGAFSYLQFKYRKLLPLAAAKAAVQGGAALQTGQLAKSNEDKTKYFIEAINFYSRYAAGVMKVPAIGPYLKASKGATKKHKVYEKKLAFKYDKVLTLLSQCFKSCPFKFKVVDKIEGDQGNKRKVDHELGTIFFSRLYCNELRQILIRGGLFSLVNATIMDTARIMSMTNDRGLFTGDQTRIHIHMMQLLQDFEAFAHHHPEAPKYLVRRERKKKKMKEDPQVG